MTKLKVIHSISYVHISKMSFKKKSLIGGVPQDFFYVKISTVAQKDEKHCHNVSNFRRVSKNTKALSAGRKKKPL